MNEKMIENRYWMWLASTSGMNTKWFYKLLQKYVTTQNIFYNIGEIKKVFADMPSFLSEQLIKTASQTYIDDMFSELLKKQIEFVTPNTNDYPYFLNDMENAPLILYYKGKLPKYWDRATTVVGTRDASQKGYHIMKNLIKEIAEEEVAIVSGMARGTDSAAHLGALEAKGTTIAVLANGVDIVYPKENAELYERIIQNGAVVSEHKPSQIALPRFFPIRNRIMAGLTSALIVGEAPKKSGVVSTVQYAENMNRQILAIPGNIDSELSYLPNELIKNGVPLLNNAKVFFEIMGWQHKQICSKNSEIKKLTLDLLEQQIYNLLLKDDLTSEQLSIMLNISVIEINQKLTDMEIMGVIRCLPGNIFSIDK